MMAPDVLPLVGPVGGGFLAGALAGYAIKKIIKIVSRNCRAVYCCISVYEYQRIIRCKLGENSSGIAQWAYMGSKYHHSYIK